MPMNVTVRLRLPVDDLDAAMHVMDQMALSSPLPIQWQMMDAETPEVRRACAGGAEAHKCVACGNDPGTELPLVLSRRGPVRVCQGCLHR